MFHFLKLVLCLNTLALSSTLYAGATAFDHYLIKKNIIDQNFIIQNKQALNDILQTMSQEDSRTLPYQVDQNMLMEKMQSNADHIEIEGAITTADFEQFEKDVGIQKVENLIKANSLQHCTMLFEHQFQRVNPYSIHLKLASTDQRYSILINNTECQFD